MASATGDELRDLQKKAQNLSTLIEVSAIVNSTLDLDEVVRLVMEKAQEVMNAEASSVLLLNPQTGRLEVQSALGEVGEKVRETLSLEIGQGIAGWIAQTGQPLNVPDVSKDPRFYDQVDRATGFRTRSILGAPLVVRGRVIGVAEVINRRDGRPFDDDDIELFTAFCRQVALAIENARMHREMLERQRLEQQLEAAKVIQESFLPKEMPSCPMHRFEVAAHYEPARAIGGDFYDFIALDGDRLGVVVGDVSGKGIPAALFMARLISDLHTYAKADIPPHETLSRLNAQLTKRSQRGMFVTLIYAILDAGRGRLTYANAGHVPPLLIAGATGQVQRLQQSRGIPLGIRGDASYAPASVQLDHSDHVLIYTDGLTEAKNPQRQLFSLEQLIREVRRPWRTPSELVHHVVDRVRTFIGEAPPADDVTLVAVKWC